MAEHASGSNLKLRYVVPDLHEPASAVSGPYRLEAAANKRFENVLYWKTDISADSDPSGPKKSPIQTARTEAYGKASNSAAGGALDSAGVAYRGAKKTIFGKITGKKD